MSNNFRILSIDGGGIRGAFPISVLAEFENNIDGKLFQYFDLISGTSTGAIIALGLAHGVSASKILKLYSEKGKDIFEPNKGGVVETILNVAQNIILNGYFNPTDLPIRWIKNSKYKSDCLGKELSEIFKENLIGNLKTRVTIPAFSLINGKPTVFKTPHRPDLIRDRHFRIVDVALASSAAPTYFPYHRNPKNGEAYVDGGVWANNPSLVGFLEALKIKEECPDFKFASINILGIGTGKNKKLTPSKKRDEGLLWWLKDARLLDLINIANAEAVENQLDYLANIEGLVNGLKKGIKHRIDFQIFDENFRLDNTNRIPELITLGKSSAVEDFSFVKKNFFQNKTKEFSPFEL